MSGTATVASTKGLFAEMRTALNDLGQQVQRLSDIYKRGYESDRIGWKSAVIAEFPTVPHRFWDAIERVADGKLLPDVVARGCAGLHLFSKVSIPDQRRILDRGIEVWTGGSDHRLVPAHLADAITLRKAIDRDGNVLTVEEQASLSRDESERRERYQQKQREAIKERVNEELENDPPLKWRADRGHIFMLVCPTYLTADDLRAMIADLESSRDR